MISVVDLESGFSPFEFEPGAEERAHSQFAEAGNYLIEPLAGILKAGAFTLFGARFGIKKLERNLLNMKDVKSKTIFKMKTIEQTLKIKNMLSSLFIW